MLQVELTILPYLRLRYNGKKVLKTFTVQYYVDDGEILVGFHGIKLCGIDHLPWYIFFKVNLTPSSQNVRPRFLQAIN